MFLLALLSVPGALIDTDGSMLFDPGQTLSTLVMFTHSSCQQCQGLRPHMEKMQEQLHADGAAVLLTAIDVEAHPTVPNLVGVQYFPTFALFPAGGVSPPKVFGGTSLRPLVRWLLEQLAALGAYRPVTRGAVARDATLHPAAVDIHPLGMKRAPPLSDDTRRQGGGNGGVGAVGVNAGGGGSVMGAVHASRPASWVDVAPLDQLATRRWESANGGSGGDGGGGGSDGGGGGGGYGDDGDEGGTSSGGAGDGSGGPKGSMPSIALVSSQQPQHGEAPTATDAAGGTAAAGSLASAATDPTRPRRANVRGHRRGFERDALTDALLLGGMFVVPLLYLAYSYAMRPYGDAAKLLLRDSAAIRRPPSRLRAACTRLEAAATLATERCREVIDAAAVHLLHRVEAWLEGGAGREREARPQRDGQPP